MPKSLFSFSITPTRKTKNIVRMARDWQKRAQAMQAQFTYEVADQTRKDVVSRIPKSRQYQTYAKSLVTSRVLGLPQGRNGYAIHAPRKAKKLDEKNADKTLLYVLPKTRDISTSPKLTALKDHSPWTVDTLPFMPSSKEAKVVSRTVRKSDVNKVRSARLDDKREWSRSLKKSGFRPSRQKDPKIFKNKVVPDITMDALRLEFGFGAQPRAHWRPAISQTIKKFIPNIMESRPNLTKSLTDPNFASWSSWPTKTKKDLSANSVKQFKDFVKILGIKGTT